VINILLFYISWCFYLYFVTTFLLLLIVDRRVQYSTRTRTTTRTRTRMCVVGGCGQKGFCLTVRLFDGLVVQLENDTNTADDQIIMMSDE
jgi:hypothetical protein